MIINLIDTEKYPLLSKIMRYLKIILKDFTSVFTSRSLYYDSEKLKKYYKLNFPKLKLDSVGNTTCVSCKLCVDICPTNAISLEQANLVNFPNTLTTGEAPLHFYLKVDDCTKCGLCQEVCYVDALELTESYQVAKVDLADIKNSSH